MEPITVVLDGLGEQISEYAAETLLRSAMLQEMIDWEAADVCENGPYRSASGRLLREGRALSTFGADGRRRLDNLLILIGGEDVRQVAHAVNRIARLRRSPHLRDTGEVIFCVDHRSYARMIDACNLLEAFLQSHVLALVPSAVTEVREAQARKISGIDTAGVIKSVTDVDTE